MKSGSPSKPDAVPGKEDVGVPGLRTWRQVYLWVIGSFVLWVVLLTALTRIFQ